MFSFTYQGISSVDKCEAVERPSIPAPVPRIETIVVPGRNGSLHISDNTYEELPIVIELNFKAKTDAEFYANNQVIRNWLIGDTSSESVLTLSDMPDEYYKVNYVTLSDTTRVNKVVGKLTATFYCDPFVYTDDGDSDVILNTSKMFPVVFNCEPLYTLRVTNDNAIIKVRDKASVKIVGASGQTVIIDTRLNLAYTEDGDGVSIDGDIADLKLDKGVAKFETLSGLTGAMTPRWRHL